MQLINIYYHPKPAKFDGYYQKSCKKFAKDVCFDRHNKFDRNLNIANFFSNIPQI